MQAAARAFCTAALAAVQPWEWALLELMMSNEKKHRHRHPLSQENTDPPPHHLCVCRVWVSTHGLLCLLLHPQWSCKRD